MRSELMQDLFSSARVINQDRFAGAPPDELRENPFAPPRTPIVDTLPNFCAPFTDRVNISGGVVVIREIIGNVSQHTFFEGIDEAVKIAGMKVKVVVFRLHKVRTVSVEAHMK